MKKILFILFLLLFPVNVFAAGEIVFDVESLKVSNDEIFIGGWALIAEKNFSAGESIDVSNNVNATIKIIAVGESNNVETVGERNSFTAGDRTFKNNKNKDLLFPSRCNRVNFTGNANTCGQTIYKDGNDKLNRGHLTCSGGTGSGCLVRNTDFAYKFDLKSLKEKYGNQTIKFIIRIEYYDVKLNYGNKYFTMSKNNNDKITKSSNLVVSESSIISLKNDISIVEDTKDILIDTSSYSILVKSVGTKFNTNTNLGRVLNSSAGFLYNDSTYWKDAKYSINGATFIEKTERYDKDNGIYKGCHYGTSYCNGNFTYNIKHYNLKYGGISGNYASVGTAKSDGWANATWGSVTGGLKLTINDIFIPDLKECDDNLVLTKQNTDDCLNPSIAGECEHSISRSVENISANYENLTSNECKEDGYSSKMIHTKNYKFKQNININVFNSLNDSIPVYDIKTFRGGSFSIGANYANDITKEDVTGSDNYYVEYYIKVDGSCKARYIEVDYSEGTGEELIINNDYIKNNYYNNVVTSSVTEWYDSNNYKNGKNNTNGDTVFNSGNNTNNYNVNFILRSAYINLGSSQIYYSLCPNGVLCKALSNEYFIPLNYPDSEFRVDIDFKNINKLNFMNELENTYNYKCLVNVESGKLDNYRYRIIDLTNPFPNLEEGVVPENWNIYLDAYKSNKDFLFKRKDLEYYVKLWPNELNVVRDYNKEKDKIDSNLFNKYLYINSEIAVNGESKFITDNRNIFDRKVNSNDYKLIGESGVE